MYAWVDDTEGHLLWYVWISEASIYSNDCQFTLWSCRHALTSVSCMLCVWPCLYAFSPTGDHLSARAASTTPREQHCARIRHARWNGINDAMSLGLSIASHIAYFTRKQLLRATRFFALPATPIPPHRVPYARKSYSGGLKEHKRLEGREGPSSVKCLNVASFPHFNWAI